MTQAPLYDVIEERGGWMVRPYPADAAPRWQVRFDTRGEAVELADHLEYEPDDSPVGKPDHYERLPEPGDLPTYRHIRKF